MGGAVYETLQRRCATGYGLVVADDGEQQGLVLARALALDGVAQSVAEEVQILLLDLHTL
jgi:hypothetical protein